MLCKIALQLLLTMMLIGCGQSRVERTHLTGQVTFDGQPISKGRILFIPDNGPTWGAEIREGTYSTEGTKGVPTGDLRVEIEAYRTPASYQPSNTDAPEDAPQEQYVPAKFNTQSELRMTIEPGSGKVEKDFQLNSQ